ncbi:hypothetical protein [Shewanella nanhaiensis]|uniref:Bacterial Ig-like domain-containing protein n=1 Tax=Shewanella nanhaiensis TaxID=2864872 RepID=A0ABS7EAI3_9GAMM|nr:hypothetical protein [Shewanella nanhaiensis]MBW8186693.1 hypothetical protein [Shewanella nanhaiensis]
MSNHIKLALAVSAALSMSGCLEVEDNNNNDDVVAALEAQNQLLQDQNTANALPITLSGTLKGATDDVDLSDAQVSIKFAGEWSTPVSIVDAKILLEKQPAYSDFTLKVESPSEAFVAMTYKSLTRLSGQGQVVNQDLGEILVGKPKEKVLTLLQTGENTFVEDLAVYPLYEVEHQGYNIHNLVLQQPEDLATFTKETGEYKLMLAEGIPTEIHAELDVDSDGVNDFELEIGQSGLASQLLSSSKVWAEDTLYLKEINQLNEYNLRLTILNEQGEVLEGARVSSENNDHGNAYFDYDSVTGQYVLETAYRGGLNVEIPSFQVGELHYTSAEIGLYETEFEQQYRVSISGSQYRDFRTEVVEGELNLAVNLSTFSYESPSIEVLSKNVKDSSLEVFYSAPVALVEEDNVQTSVELTATAVVTIIPGNTLNDQGVTPGTTYVSVAPEAIDTSVELTLNGTKLTASPAAELADGEYQYRVGDLVNVIADEEQNVYSDDSEVFTVSKSAFNVNDVVLDNKNYTTDGALIVAKNTADVAVNCNWCGGSGSVKLYMPTSIRNLNELTYTLTSYTNNGVAQDYHRIIRVITNGQLYSTNKELLLKAAQNENINSNYYYYYPQVGTSLDSGYRYSNYTYLNLNDDVVGSENSMTFDYSYTTKEGDTQTGTITYKVR